MGHVRWYLAPPKFLEGPDLLSVFRALSCNLWEEEDEDLNPQLP